MADKIYNIGSFNRPPRIQNNLRPVDIDIPAPPIKPDDVARNLLMALLPMSSFLVMGLFYALIFSGSGGLGWLYAIPMLLIALFTFIVSYVTFGEQKYEQHQKWITQIRDYHRLLDKKESRLLAARELQENLLFNKFEPPRNLLQRAKDREITIWERRKEDQDFLAFRLGMGETVSSINIKPPDPDFNSPDIRRAFNMYVEYKKIPDVPVLIDLQKIGSVALVGSRSLTTALARSLLAQISVLNSPDDLHLYVFSSKIYYQTWMWMRWLPHTNIDHFGGRPSFMAFTKEYSQKLLANLSKLVDNARQVSEQSKQTEFKLSHSAVLLFDNEVDVRSESIFWDFVKFGKDRGIYSIFICDKLEDVPSDCGSVVQLQSDTSTSARFKFSVAGAEAIKSHGKPDRLTLIEVDNLSHRLLPIMVRSVGRNSQIPTRVNFMQMHEGFMQTHKKFKEHKVNSIEDLHILEFWMRTPGEDGVLPFKVPVGSATYKDPLMVNLSENNDGPHGLIAGTTGAGKSELLQTLVSSLALNHHPYFLNFMFVDFKGESTFGIFEKLPHTVGLISNLDKSGAARALEALNTENLRRQKVLRDLELKEITDYHKRLLASNKILDPKSDFLPHLFVVVDEFAEMASEMPEFLDRLNQIARVGRSLGIHLVLATQRPANVVKDEMRANLNFRICLRVQTIDDSRDMLRRPDAAYLPHDLPGRAYFQLGDAGTLSQFQVAHVGAEYKSLSQETQKFDLYRVEYEEQILIKDEYYMKKEEEKKDREKSGGVTTIARALVETMDGLYSSMPYIKMPRLLLPPLSTKTRIQDICVNDNNNENNDRLDWRKYWAFNFSDKQTKDESESQVKKKSNFQVPVGILDSLATHSQPPYYLNFLEKGGHVMAIGGPQSGKTYFLQSLCYSLAVHYSPKQVNIYALSFSGKDLDILEGLPHIGSVIDGNDSEKLGRLLRFLQNEMDRRKTMLGDRGAKDLETYNQIEPRNMMPYICVLIDDFGSLKGFDYDNELDIIEKLLKLRMYGLHFVITGSQFSDIPSRMTNLILHRIVFDLIDHSEYLMILGRLDTLDFGTLPHGRCFVNIENPPMRCQIGKPPDQSEWNKMKDEMTVAWNGEKPTSIKNLPISQQLSEMLNGKHGKETISSLLGIDGDDLSVYWFDWKKVPHLLIGGARQAGRTSLLQSAVLSLADSYSPDEVIFILIDGSNSLERLYNLPHVLATVSEEEGFVESIANLQTELDHRREHNEDLLNLPHIFIVIDDYDLLCDAFIGEGILSKLGKHVRQDSRLNFHLLISTLPESVARSTDMLMKQFKLSKNGVSLGNIELYEDMGGKPTQAMRNEEFKEGRGYVFDRSSAKLVQFAYPDDKSFEIVFSRWLGNAKAEWKRQASEEKIEEVRNNSEPVIRSDWLGVTSSPRSYIDQEASLLKYNIQQGRSGRKDGK